MADAIPGTLTELAGIIIPNLRQHFPVNPATGERDRQALKFAEELLESVDAFREYRSTGNRAGMGDELSDVIITVHILGQLLNVPIPSGTVIRGGVGELMLDLLSAAGAVIKAYNRWAGHSRKTGGVTDIQVALGRTSAATYALAAGCRINMDAAWRGKARIILTRGWREQPDDEHLCHARGCKTPVPPLMFMCKPHWFMLPQRMRDAVWAEYVPGQEERKDPTPEYLAVTMECIDYVAAKEAA